MPGKSEIEDLKRRTQELLAKSQPPTLQERTAPVVLAKDEELRKREGAVAAKEKGLEIWEKSCATREQAVKETIETLENARKVLEDRGARAGEREEAITSREEAASKREQELDSRDEELKAETRELVDRKKVLDEVTGNQIQIEESLAAREKAVEAQEAEAIQVRALADVMKRIIDELELRPGLEQSGLWEDFEKLYGGS